MKSNNAVFYFGLDMDFSFSFPKTNVAANKFNIKKNKTPILPKENLEMKRPFINFLKKKIYMNEISLKKL